MNIAFLTPVVYPFVKGGVEKRIHEIGRRLAADGHEVTVYSRNWWGGNRNYDHEGMTLRAIAPQCELYADGDRRSIPNALNFAKNAVGPLRSGQHDVVSTPVAPYFHVLSSRLALGLNTPLTVTWHEVWDDYWRDYMGRMGVFGKATERVVANIPHHPITPSDPVAKRLASIGSDYSDITVIPNGVDFATLQAIESKPDGYDVLYAGRLIEDKNVELLLQAFDRVANPEEDTLGIIGEGPQSQQLKHVASQLDSRDQIDFLGFLENHDDVIAEMKAARLFVSPSIREGFGITLLEAMAADCIVVTVKHEYTAGSEIVGDAGFVTDPTIESLADAIRDGLNGIHPAEDPVETARKYDWDNVSTQTEQLYRKII